MFLHLLGTGVVRGKCHLHVVLEPVQHETEISSPTHDVFLGIKGVSHLHLIGRFRHQLHQTLGPLVGDRGLVEVGLGLDDGFDKGGLHAESLRRLGNYLFIVPDVLLHGLVVAGSPHEQPEPGIVLDVAEMPDPPLILVPVDVGEGGGREGETGTQEHCGQNKPMGHSLNHIVGQIDVVLYPQVTIISSEIIFLGLQELGGALLAAEVPGLPFKDLFDRFSSRHVSLTGVTLHHFVYHLSG
jgi:hypothetical protein